jgi:hypothetical protein
MQTDRRDCVLRAGRAEPASEQLASGRERPRSIVNPVRTSWRPSPFARSRRGATGTPSGFTKCESSVMSEVERDAFQVG